MQHPSGATTPQQFLRATLPPVLMPNLHAGETPASKDGSEHIYRGHKPMAWGPDVIQSGRADCIDEALNWPVVSRKRRAGSFRTLDTWINMVDPGVVNTSRGWNGIGPNWPQVPALYGSSQRINPSPVVRNGGNLMQGVPNTARWNQLQYRAYLLGEQIARQHGIYSGTPTSGTPTKSPL